MRMIGQDLVRLCHSGLDATQLRVQVFQRLRRAVPFDAFWCATADPATLLFSGVVMDPTLQPAVAAMVTNELLESDVNKFVHLARGGRPVNTLYTATEGEPARSARYRDILRPMGLGNELRAVLCTAGACWGLMCLHRAASDPGFTPADVAFVRQLGPHLAEGLRSALLLTEVESAPMEEAEGPGLIVLCDDFSVAAVTPAAERWLAELSDWPRGSGLPQAVQAVAIRRWALDRAGESRSEAMPRLRTRTRSGQWLVLHASRLSGPDAAGRTAIIIEPAQPAEVAPLVLQAYSLTEREAAVSGFVLRGLSTDDIARVLCISPLTVQQHVKAIFDKTGVRSRRELVGQIFAQYYRPRLQNDRSC
jgi:DNA-binding CsgD family transcriptional regulator